MFARSGFLVAAVTVSSFQALAAGAPVKTDDERAQEKMIETFVENDLVATTKAVPSVCGRLSSGFETTIQLRVEKNGQTVLVPLKTLGVTQATWQMLMGLTSDPVECQ